MRTLPPSVQTYSHITKSRGSSVFGVFEETLYWFSRDAMVYSHQQYTGVALTTASLGFILIDGKNRISMHFWFVFLWWISVVNFAHVVTAVYRSTSENCLLVLCPHAWPCFLPRFWQCPVELWGWWLGSPGTCSPQIVCMIITRFLCYFVGPLSFCCCWWWSSSNVLMKHPKALAWASEVGGPPTSLWDE